MAKKSEKSSLTFEEALERLSAVADKLESDDVTLEQSLQYYEEGITLTNVCLEKLTQAQQRLKELKERSDELFETIEKLES
ncbi:MAG: exodeoxyribonuclease VII small subunit [Chlorobi bacterium]|nr:exodeoxyribonuclease VII small subunit [Chlorobiota bacterium]